MRSGGHPPARCPNAADRLPQLACIVELLAAGGRRGADTRLGDPAGEVARDGDELRSEALLVHSGQTTQI